VSVTFCQRQFKSVPKTAMKSVPLEAKKLF